MDVIDDSALISGHLPISVVVSASIPDHKLNPSQPRRDFKRADWSAFSSMLCEMSRSAMLECKFSSSRHRSKPQEAMEAICKVINDCLNTASGACIPLRSNRPNAKRWWHDPAVPEALSRLRKLALDDVGANQRQLVLNGTRHVRTGTVLSSWPSRGLGIVLLSVCLIQQRTLLTGRVSTLLSIHVNATLGPLLRPSKVCQLRSQNR